MRKMVNVFLNYILVSTILVNVIACKWLWNYDLADYYQQDISATGIVPDIEKRTNKIMSDRLDYDGEDISSLKKWYLNNSHNWLYKTNKKLEFVKNLEAKINYQANQKVIDEFDLLANNTNNFASFANLEKQLKDYNLGKTNVKIDWDSIIVPLLITDVKKNKIRNKLLAFYNIFAQVYGKEIVLKILYRMAKIKESNVLGFIKNWYFYDYPHNDSSLIQVMGINPQAFSEKIQNQGYNSGLKASKSIIRTIVHEYGHALANFLCLTFQGRQKINSLADNNADAWWNNYFNLFGNLKKKLVATNKIDDETNFLISSLANGTNINELVYQKLLAYGIVRSNYGREGHRDLFAEAFDQWIDTENKQRNIAWEKLDKFFRIDLPKVLLNKSYDN